MCNCSSTTSGATTVPETFCLHSGSALAESVWVFLVSTFKVQNTSKSNSQISEQMWNQPRLKKPPCQSENSPRRDRNSNSFTYDIHSYEEAELLTHIYMLGPHLTSPSALKWSGEKKGDGVVQSITKATTQRWETWKSCTQLILKYQLRAVRYLSTMYLEYAKNQQDNMGCC